MNIYIIRSRFVGSIASLTMAFPKSSILNQYVDASVDHGIVVVTATGNTIEPSCYKSPGSSLSINVGSHGYVKNNCTKPMGKYSNFGRCNDIMAPGVGVKSAYFLSESGESIFICIPIKVLFGYAKIERSPIDSHEVNV